jgi:hypothetical protein
VAHTLIEHWDGRAWSVVPSPDVADVSNFLTGVNALTSDDAWAVGWWRDEPGSGYAQTLTLHWDGSTWAIVPSPNQGTDDNNYLQGVKAFSSSDGWAVGQGYVDGQQIAITLHWDGESWKPVPGPDPSISGEWLYAVDGVSSTDLWAVGTYFDFQLVANQPLFAHWDGTAWSPYDFGTIADADVSLGVLALASDDVWAVGTTNTIDDPSVASAQHWKGISWTADDALPVQKGNDNLYTGVAALSSADVWIAGWYTDYDTGAARTMVQHWDGTPFGYVTTLDTPEIGTGDTKLGGIIAFPATSELWAVGSYTDPASGALRTLALQDCPIQLRDDGFRPVRTTIPHPGGTVGWSMAFGTSTHRIVDGTGLALYDSGLKAPPASFLATLFASGTYTVVDQGTGSTMTLKVPAEAFPHTGSVSTAFRITWATHKVRTDRVFDVQIRRPGSTTWEDWETGVRGAGDRFAPDGGPGIYSFRARLRSIRTGAAADYSPPVSIQVT